MPRTYSFLALVFLFGCSETGTDTNTETDTTNDSEEPQDSDPVEDTDVQYTSRLDGLVYEIDFRTATLVEPPLGSELLGWILGERRMVVQFSDDGGDVSLISALTTAGQDNVHSQDPCSRTIAFDDEITWADPLLTISTSNFNFDIEDLTVPIRSLQLTAKLSEDGTAFTDLAVTADIDSEDFPPPDKGENTPCEFVGVFGIDCQPCDEDPTRETCLTVEMDSGVANAAELSAELQTITADDVAATAECQ